MPVDTTGYPAYTSKQEMLEDLDREGQQNPFSVLRRMSNTDTSTFADPTYELPNVS